MSLYRITTRNGKFCGGIVTSINKVGHEIVVETAPCFGYMRGWGIKRVRENCLRYSNKIERMD